MVNTYKLVNPYIQGTFKRSVKATNSNEAANMFYKNLSKHFNNSIPKFYFSVQKGSSGLGKYYHFEVKENRVDDEVSFEVKKYHKGADKSNMGDFEEKLNNFKAKFSQDGGKKNKKSKKSKDDSDSDFDDSSEEFYKRARQYPAVTQQPIYYWWYDPFIYRLDKLYIPTFYSYVVPTLELALLLP
jgi:hypothetical protein